MLLPRQMLWLAFAALAAAPAFAGDFTLGGRTELWYDDNVLGSDQNQVSDGELRITPDLELSEQWGTAEARLDFKPTYELFFDEKDLRGFSYQTEGSLAWRPTPRTSFELQDTFWRDRSLRLFTSGADPGSTPAESTGRDPFNRNVAQLVATHRFTPVDTLQVTGSFALWDFSEPRRFDQQTGSVGLNFQHHVSQKVSLGAGASFTRLTIEKLGAIPERDTDYVNLSFIANYEPVDTFFVRLSAGPTYIHQPRVEPPSLVRGQLYRFSGNDILVGLLPSTCPTLSTGEFFDGPGCNLFGVDPVAQELIYDALVARALDPVPLVGAQPDRDDYTYFADISLEKKWESSSVSIAYRRDEGSSSSAGVSTIADTFELRGSIQPARRFRVSGAVVWEDRKETETGGRFVTILDTVPGTPTSPAINNLVPVSVRSLAGGSSSRNIESLSTYLNASYRLSARMHLDAAAAWRKQEAPLVSTFNDYERFTVMFGLRVELEPFRW